MKAKTIGGVKFKLHRWGLDLRLEITDGDAPVVLVPRNGSLQLHHLQTLEDWIKQAQEEIEYGR